MVGPEAQLFVVLISTHLLDVLHLIIKVTDCPLARHHLLLSIRGCPLHYTVHFRPMMLQRVLWHPIGHVSEVLRETGSHRSGFCSHPLAEADLYCLCVCAFVCRLQVHCMCFLANSHAYIGTLNQIFPTLPLLSNGNRRLGTES